MLLASGHSVGQFTSPHLTHITERCLVNGKPQGVEEFDAAIRSVLQHAGDAGLEPSYFVVSAAACFLEFARLGLDWNVIEVGLGGLYDATNTIAAPEVCVITSIGFDHTHILGDSIEEIAENKAGIVKAGVPLVVGRVPEAARKVIRAKATAAAAPVYFHGEDFMLSDNQENIEIADEDVPLPALARLPAGSYQRENLVLAARVGKLLGLSDDAINKGAQNSRWPGRLEQLRVNGCEVLLDAAHNPDGVSALCEFVDKHIFREEISEVVFLIGMLARKNTSAIVELLLDLHRRAQERGISIKWICTEAPGEGAYPAETLAESLPAAQVMKSASDALFLGLQSAKEEEVPLVIAGSIFLLGEIRPLLGDFPFLAYQDG